MKVVRANTSSIVQEAPNVEGRQGFSLIEILIVLAIISILAMMAIPSKTGRINKVRIMESINLIEPYKAHIQAYYLREGEFPKHNRDVDLPEPDKIIGNYLRSVTVEDGAMQLTLGNKIREDLVGKVVSVRPVYVDKERAVPISWVCGFDPVPKGMRSAGKNRTNVEKQSLPIACL